MIHFRDSLTLALTKLRTRKVRLVITIVVSGLLFAILMGASLVARGAFASIESFSNEGLGKRYIVAGTDASSSGNIFNNQTIIDRAEALHKDELARKKAEAKRLDITFEPTSDRGPIEEYDTPNGKQKNLNFTHPLAKKAVQEYLATQPQNGMDAFKKLGGTYQAKSYYSSKNFPYSIDGQLQVLKDGKETYGNQGQKDYSAGPPSPLDSFTQNWALMSSELLKPFILEGENLQTDAQGNVPVILPFSAAEQLAGLAPLPGTAKTAQKLERTKELRQKAKGIAFAMCYRNNTSTDYINRAIAAQQEIAQNKNKKDYTQPDLIYGLPTEPCGTSPVTRDVRSADQKRMDAKQAEFDAAFGKAGPEQFTVRFRVVGIVSDPSYQSASGVGQIISSLVRSSLGSGWYTPLEEGVKQPILTKLFDDTAAAITGARPTNYAEFATATQAQTFIDKASCSPDYSQFDKMSAATVDHADPYKACNDSGRPFQLQAFGSNSLALNDLRKTFSKVFRIAALVVAVIASIIMMGTVGRMVTDSRRETAVFRAIGAKRMDIAQIYLLYTLLLSLLIGLFAFAGGSIAAGVAQSKFAQDFTVEALVAYNSTDLTQSFILYKLYAADVLYLIGLAVVTGLLSVAIPLLRNVRRNPIRDMRDDT